MGTPHRKYTRELLQEAVNRSDSISDVLRCLGIALAGGNHSHISRLLKRMEINISHFTRSRRNYNRGRRYPIKNLEALLTTGCERRRDHKRLRKALLQIGTPYKCVGCPNDGTWLGKPLTLEIDHVNGDWSDNRRENLQFICPNCHAQKTLEDGAMARARRKALEPAQLRELPLIDVTESPITEQAKPHSRTINTPKKPSRKARRYPAGFNWRALPRVSQRRVERPDKDKLAQLVWQKPITQIGADYGVSGNAIEKWCKDCGIVSKPARGYWNRRQSGQSHEEALSPAPVVRGQKVLPKLSDDQVVEALCRLESGIESLRSIARSYGIAHTVLIDIKQGKTYKHVPRNGAQRGI